MASWLTNHYTRHTHTHTKAHTHKSCCHQCALCLSLHSLSQPTHCDAFVSLSQSVALTACDSGCYSCALFLISMLTECGQKRYFAIYGWFCLCLSATNKRNTKKQNTNWKLRTFWQQLIHIAPFGHFPHLPTVEATVANILKNLIKLCILFTHTHTRSNACVCMYVNVVW